MPQVGGHLIVAEKVINSLNNPQYIQQHRNAYNLGAVGPDMTFFLFDPIGESEILNTILDVYMTIRDIKQVLDDAANAVLNPAIDLADWFSGGLLQSLGGLVTLSFESFKNLMILTLLPGSTETVENPFAGLNQPGLPNNAQISLQATDLSMVFRRFGHPYSHDGSYKSAEPAGVYDNWWWTDVLHYRRTGPFAQALMGNAGANALLRAYATGYWTHVGADVTGHPFVNSVVGGPFREHVIRHMVVENIIDAWLWDHYKNADIINAGLEREVDVGGDIHAIAALLVQTMQQIYTHPQGGLPAIQPNRFPGSTPSEGDLERAFQTMLTFLELSTNAGITPPIPPPDSMDEVFQEVMNELTKSAKQVGQSFNNIKWWQFWLWLLALFLAALRALALIIKLITLPGAILTRVLMLAPRWLIYEIQLALYEYVMNARFALALSGWGKASNVDLVRPFSKIATVNNPFRAGNYYGFTYPYKQTPRMTQAFWLADPMYYANLDAPLCESSPYPAYALPAHFVDGPSYPAAHDGSIQSFANAFSPAATIDIERATFSTPQFGNAVDFSTRLITGQYPSALFDLDGDYGYGFLGWEGPPPVYKP